VATTIIPQATAFDQVIHLRVSRDAYDALVENLGDGAHVRLTYDGETLEIVSPSLLHEIVSRLVAVLLDLVSLEWGLDISDLGSTRFKPPGEAEFEADGAWYLSMKTQVRNRKNIDLTVDAPPDLLLETDISTSSSDKLEIFATMRVPEVWLFNLEGFQAKALENGEYVPIEMSRTIAGLPISEIARRIEGEAVREKSDMYTFRREWQHWLREHKHLHDASRA
jgi:Uma2 family endonuclease